jgi:hypothetical protein
MDGWKKDPVETYLLRLCPKIFQVKKIKQSRYRPGVAQSVPGS